MTQKLLRICEEEIVDKQSIITSIEDWKISDKYQGIIGISDICDRLIGILTDGIIRDLADDASPDKIRSVIDRQPVVCINGDLYKFGSYDKIRFGRDCNPDIKFIPVINENYFIKGLKKVSDIIENQNTVVGLGYVGITLVAYMATRDVKVYGVDIDHQLVDNLKNRKIHVQEHGLKSAIDTGVTNGKIHLSTSMEPSGSYVVAVGTPVNESKTPDYQALISTCDTIARVMHIGSIVIFRSTVGVGVTRSLLVKQLEQKSGLLAGKDFFVSFCPERTAEGVALRELAELPQLLSGLTSSCLARAASFWRQLSPTVVECNSLEVAELAKLANNSFRDLSFAFANELASICHNLNIDALEVVEKANQGYVRNRIAFPSIGVGGYCLTKDPYIFANSTINVQESISLSALGREKNDASLNFPIDVVSRWISREQDLSLSSILIVGVAFKGEPATSDIRMSPSVEVLKRLTGQYPSVSFQYFDFEYTQPSLSSVGLNEVTRFDIESGDETNQFDAVLILNNHRRNASIKYHILRERGLIFDGYRQIKNLIDLNSITYATIGQILFAD